MLEAFIWAMEQAAGATRWYIENLRLVIVWAAVVDVLVWGLIIAVRRMMTRRPSGDQMSPAGSARA